MQDVGGCQLFLNGCLLEVIEIPGWVAIAISLADGFAGADGLLDVGVAAITCSLARILRRLLEVMVNHLCPE
jgi:hypothetical protein